MSNIGKLLKEYRVRNGIKQDYVGELLECDQATISRVERGVVLPSDNITSRVRSLIEEEGNRFEVGDGWHRMLKFFRYTRRLRQVDLAELLGVGASEISRWESGFCKPDLRHQVVLRDLILKPLENSSKVSQLMQSIVRSPTNVAVGYGPYFLFGSATSTDPNVRNSAPRGRVWAEWNDGLFVPEYEHLLSGDFWSGNIAYFRSHYHLSKEAALIVEITPIAIGDGITLMMSSLVPTTVDKVGAAHCEFETTYLDALVS